MIPSERKKRGTVEELPSGRHRVRVRIGGSLKTVVTFDSKEEAEAARVTMAVMRVMLTSKDDPSTYVVGDIPRVEAPGAIVREGHVYVLDPGYNALNAIDGAEARYFRATVFVAGGAVTLFEGHA